MKLLLSIKEFCNAASYRIPMPVMEARVFEDADFAVCPRCRLTLPREYICYCDRCGQRLNWALY